MVSVFIFCEIVAVTTGQSYTTGVMLAQRVWHWSNIECVSPVCQNVLLDYISTSRVTIQRGGGGSGLITPFQNQIASAAIKNAKISLFGSLNLRRYPCTFRVSSPHISAEKTEKALIDTNIFLIAPPPRVRNIKGHTLKLRRNEKVFFVYFCISLISYELMFFSEEWMFNKTCLFSPKRPPLLIPKRTKDGLFRYLTFWNQLPCAQNAHPLLLWGKHWLAGRFVIYIDSDDVCRGRLKNNQ